MFGLSSPGLVGLRRVVSPFGGEEGLGHGDEGDNGANGIVADAEFFVAKVIRLGFHGLFLRVVPRTESRAGGRQWAQRNYLRTDDSRSSRGGCHGQGAGLTEGGVLAGAVRVTWIPACAGMTEKGPGMTEVGGSDGGGGGFVLSLGTTEEGCQGVWGAWLVLAGRWLFDCLGRLGGTTSDRLAIPLRSGRRGNRKAWGLLGTE